MKKLACLFPGIGYTCDKPLLYYSWKMLAQDGWEVIPVNYSGMLFGLPEGTKSSPGSKTMHIPVKLSSNSLALILTSPLAGSLI